MSGTDIAYGRPDIKYNGTSSYAMSGADIEYASSIYLCACYAITISGIASRESTISLRGGYAMSGTNLASRDCSTVYLATPSSYAHATACP
eukprot:1929920-Rhodomonas_salina.3